MRNQFIAQFVVLSLQQSILCANLALNVYQTPMRPFWLKFGLKGFRRADLSRCRVIKWIVAPFHGNLPNLSNDPRIIILILICFSKNLFIVLCIIRNTFYKIELIKSNKHLINIIYIAARV